MSVVRVWLNLLYRQPLRWERWHPLSLGKRAVVRRARGRLKAATTGGLSSRPMSPRWWLRRSSDGSVCHWVALRTLTLDEVVTLRKAAIDRGYDGRAWMDDAAGDINESAFFWLRSGMELADGEVICDLLVAQTEFKEDVGEEALVPIGFSVKRHVLHVRRDDWRKLRRASRKDERLAYLVLESNVPLNLDELNGKSDW